jgi:hypothetical protein
MPVPFPLYSTTQDAPDGYAPRSPNFMLFPLTTGTTAVTTASTTVFGALPSSAPVVQFTIYNNGANPVWITEAQATTPAVTAAVGQGILLNPGDLLVETNWPCPAGTVAITPTGSTSLVWTVTQ